MKMTMQLWATGPDGEQIGSDHEHTGDPATLVRDYARELVAQDPQADWTGWTVEAVRHGETLAMCAARRPPK